MSRPSQKEVTQKVDQAIRSIDEGKVTIALGKHIVQDLYELDVYDTKDLMRQVRAGLEEIKRISADSCYAGSRPPQRSYERELNKMELWAYSWESNVFGRRMYLKFCIKGDHFYYVDCHEDRPKG